MKFFKANNEKVTMLDVIKNRVSEIREELDSNRKRNYPLGSFTNKLFSNIEAARTLKDIV